MLHACINVCRHTRCKCDWINFHCIRHVLVFCSHTWFHAVRIGPTSHPSPSTSIGRVRVRVLVLQLAAGSRSPPPRPVPPAPPQASLGPSSPLAGRAVPQIRAAPPPAGTEFSGGGRRILEGSPQPWSGCRRRAASRPSWRLRPPSAAAPLQPPRRSPPSGCIPIPKTPKPQNPKTPCYRLASVDRNKIKDNICITCGLCLSYKP